jgi:hypothetical protein
VESTAWLANFVFPAAGSYGSHRRDGRKPIPTKETDSCGRLDEGTSGIRSPEEGPADVGRKPTPVYIRTKEEKHEALSISGFSRVVRVYGESKLRAERGTMRYMLLIYHRESVEEPVPPEHRQTAMEGHLAVMDEAERRGILVGVNSLAHTSAATTVRVENGKVLTTDGPFAETREQLAGYYLLDCQDLDEAIAWAARLPDCTQTRSCVEIRPVQELPAVPESFRKSKAALGSMFS